MGKNLVTKTPNPERPTLGPLHLERFKAQVGALVLLAINHMLSCCCVHITHKQLLQGC